MEFLGSGGGDLPDDLLSKIWDTFSGIGESNSSYNIPDKKSSIGESISSCSSPTKKMEVYGSAADLPDEVWFKIFILLLPDNSVYDLRCVSKRWNSLIKNPYFISQVFNNLILSSPCTIFCNSVGSFVNQAVLSSRIGLWLRIPHEKQQRGNGENVYLLGSSNGLVLSSTTEEYQIWYYVCNPITNEWVLVPNPNGRDDQRALNCLYCDTSSTRSFETTTTYKVIRIPEILNPYQMFDIEVFSSETSEWNVHKMSCPEEIVLAHPFKSNLVCNNGVLYWVEGNKTRLVVYDLNTNFKRSCGGRNECRVMNLPTKSGTHDDKYYCLGESEGSVCYSHRYGNKIFVWVLEDGKNWNLVHEISITDSDKAKPLAFNPTNRNVLILGQIGTSSPGKTDTTSPYAYNVVTKEKEVLKQHSSSTYGVLPFTIKPSPTTMVHQNKFLPAKPAN